MRFWIAIWIGLATPAAADFVPITDGKVFNETVDQKRLRIGALGLTLRVFPEGRIEGAALGRDVFGDWTWQDGYFCRDMIWGERPIDYNCQLVELDGNRIRFTSDRGQGMSAVFMLRND